MARMLAVGRQPVEPVSPVGRAQSRRPGSLANPFSSMREQGEGVRESLESSEWISHTLALSFGGRKS